MKIKALMNSPDPPPAPRPASNPGILTGGMFGESKYDVMRKVPEEVKPKTIRIDYPVDRAGVMRRLEGEGMTFPLIFKPDLGERGWRVRKIQSEQDIEQNLGVITLPFLAQEFVSLPLEFVVFYVRYPEDQKGRVVSIVGKEMLSVTGNGKGTLQDLILKKDRAKLQWETLRETYQDQLSRVVPLGESIELVSIGNHCLGTKFLNRPAAQLPHHQPVQPPRIAPMASTSTVVKGAWCGTMLG